MERIAKARVLRKLRREYQNAFYRDKGHTQMYWLSLLIKNQQKIREDHLNLVNYTKATGNTEHSFHVENCREKGQTRSILCVCYM